MTVLPDPPGDPVVPSAGPPAEPPPGRRAGLRRDRLLPFLAGLAVMLVVVLAVGALLPAQDRVTPAEVDQAIEDALASQTPDPPVADRIYAAVRPSVVADRRHRHRRRRATAQTREGTGVVVSPTGEVLTALHVVDGRDRRSSSCSPTARRSTAHDHRPATPPRTSRCVAADGLPATIPPAVLGSPGALRIGCDAYIVGNPFGLYGLDERGRGVRPRALVPATRTPTRSTRA